MNAPVNHRAARGGRVRAVCLFCNGASEPVAPDLEGEPNVWSLARGWSISYFPADFVQRDGSVGSTFTCPACNAHLQRGERLFVHATRRGAA